MNIEISDSSSKAVHIPVHVVRNDSRPLYARHSAYIDMVRAGKFGSAARAQETLYRYGILSRSNRNICIECGKYTDYSPYACELHADPNGGDGADD